MLVETGQLPIGLSRSRDGQYHDCEAGGPQREVTRVGTSEGSGGGLLPHTE